jgi:hypothetical protein
MYNFLVRDPGKRVHSDALTSLAGAGVFWGTEEFAEGAFGIEFCKQPRTFHGTLCNVFPEIFAPEKS